MAGKWIVGGLAVVAAGVGYYYYEVQQVERKLDEMAQSVQPVGNLRYSGVRIGASGKLHVDGLLFEPHDLDTGRMRAERVTFDAGNLWQLAGLRRTLDAGRLPRELGFSVSGLSLPAGTTGGQHGNATLLVLDTAGCGEYHSGRSHEVLDALGYRDIPVDFGFEYRLEGNGDSLTVRSTYGVGPLGRGTASGRFDLRAASTHARDLVPAMMTASLRSLTVDYEDQGYYPALLEFCAAQADMPVEVYREHHLDAWVEAWRVFGLQPGPALAEAYGRFIQDPTGFSLHIGAIDNPGLLWASAESPVRFLRHLGASVTVAGEDFGRVDVQPAPAASVSRSHTGTTRGGAGDPGETPESGPIALEALGEHVGRNIAVTLADGRARQGELLAIEDGGIRMRRRIGSGFMVVPIALADIVEVHPVR